MLVVPAFTPTVNPGVAEVFATTVAIEVSLELQATEVVMSCWVESLKTPVAKKRVSAPVGMVIPTGEIMTLVIVALLTLNGTDADRPPRAAPKLMIPGALPKMMPLLVPTVAIAVLSEVQVT